MFKYISNILSNSDAVTQKGDSDRLPPMVCDLLRHWTEADCMHLAPRTWPLQMNSTFT